MVEKIMHEEKIDLSPLDKMIYAGRIIIPFMYEDGSIGIGYGLSGRSPSSQARKLEVDDETKTVSTRVTDIKELMKGSPALLLYPALTVAADRFRPSRIVLLASNGVQTEHLYTMFSNNLNKYFGCGIPVYVAPQYIMDEAFNKGPVCRYDPKDKRWIDITRCEPDDSKTPRISVAVRGEEAAFYIVRQGEDGGRDYNIFNRTLEPGKGFFIGTYKGGNENPLQPFKGDPFPVVTGLSSPEQADVLSQKIFESLRGSIPGNDLRVASAVISLDAKTNQIYLARCFNNERSA